MKSTARFGLTYAQNKYDAIIQTANEDTDFVKQIHLIETFKGAGFLSAVSLMGESGDFSAFSKPKTAFCLLWS